MNTLNPYMDFFLQIYIKSASKRNNNIKNIAIKHILTHTAKVCANNN